ncbi:hypothetical protein OROHE_017613 [Orobanche hederae]
MTTALSSFNSLLRPSSHASSSFRTLQFQFPHIKTRGQFKTPSISCSSSVVKFNKHGKLRPIRAASEEEKTIVPEEGTSPPLSAATSDQTVSVAVSPSDVLTMFFQAEGTMIDSAIPEVTKALEGVEGISDLKVQVLEGIASIEFTKQTTVQATGVASGLVETIQGSGFKLQTLNLSFQDEEDLAEIYSCPNMSLAKRIVSQSLIVSSAESSHC